MQSRALYEGDGSTRLFGVPFPYLSTTHVKVYLNKMPMNYPMDWRFNGAGSIEMLAAPKPKDAIEVARVTPSDGALTRFQNGAVLTEEELNTAILQLLYLLQETRDAYDAALGGGFNRIAGNTAITGATSEDVINAVVQDVLSNELTAYLQQRISDIDLNAEELVAQRLRLDTVEELVAAIANVNGQSIATFLLDEQAARIDGDTALASDISLIGAKSGDGLSFILDLNKVKVGATESLATRLSGIQSSIDGNSAAVIAEQTARATSESAITTALDQAVSRIGNAEALIASEETTRASADSALSSSVATLQTTVGSHTTSIQQQSSSIDGLKAQYTVKIDNNGYVSGFGLASTAVNGTPTSSFVVLADKFAVVTPGKSPTVPFAVDANGVYMDTAYIRSLTVDRITGGNIGSQWNLNNSSGRIVLDTGTYMKVLGVGFGFNGDLIEWFGPKMAITSCTKANAITYVATDGSAYFGGKLSAGTLYNAAQTTNTQYNASLVVGPAGSNGGTINVVLSYSYTHALHAQTLGASYTAGSGSTYATVQLYRQIGTGTAVLVWQGNFNGSLDILNGGGDSPSVATYRIGGSITYTDTGRVAQDRTYTAVITARNEQSVSLNTGGQSQTYTQNMSIVATEQ